MNMSLKNFVFSLLAGLSFCMAESYVCTARLMVNQASGQRLIVFSDYHDATEASSLQRKSILRYAKEYDMYLVAEDNSYRCDYVGPDEVIAYPACFQSFLDALVADPVHFDPNADYSGDYSVLDPQIKNNVTPLLLLIPMAKNLAIKAATVECRQAEKISHRDGPITARQVCQAYDVLVTRTASFDDGKLYNDFYKQKLQEYYERRALTAQFFKYLEGCSCNLKKAFQNRTFEHEVSAAYQKVEIQNRMREYMTQGTDAQSAKAMAEGSPVIMDTGDELYTNFFMYLYNFLIDAAVIHEIATHPQEPLIMAYCGAWHIDSIMPVLQEAGFQVEKVWDASKKVGQSALDLDAFFEKMAPQLQSATVTSRVTQTAGIVMVVLLLFLLSLCLVYRQKCYVTL